MPGHVTGSGSFAYLGDKTLEESTHAFVPCHLGENLETALWVLKVAVLNASLDNIKRSRNNQRRGGTSNRGDKVLEPRRLVVVLELEDVLLRKSRSSEQLRRSHNQYRIQRVTFRSSYFQTTSRSVLLLHDKWDDGTHRKGPWRVSRGSPAPAPVQAETLIRDNLEDATAAERLGVCLAFDLEHVERQQHNFTDADQTAGRRVQDGLARLLAESILKVRSVVLRQVVARHGLATVLVYPLQDLCCA